MIWVQLNRRSRLKTQDLLHQNRVQISCSPIRILISITEKLYSRNASSFCFIKSATVASQDQIFVVCNRCSSIYFNVKHHHKLAVNVQFRFASSWWTSLKTTVVCPHVFTCLYCEMLSTIWAGVIINKDTINHSMSFSFENKCEGLF